MASRRRRSLPVPVPSFVEGVLDSALDRAMRVQRPAVAAYVERARGKRGHTPAETVRELERLYLVAVTAIGAAAGASAAIPGVGTGTSVATAAFEIGAFAETTALFGLAVAEVHGQRIDNLEQRRALVLALLLGDAGAQILQESAAGAGRSRAAWSQVLSQHASEETVRRTNRRLAKHFLPRFGVQQGALLIGRAIPMGVGAGIGAAGNAALARASIAAARRVFGAPPAQFPPRVVDASSGYSAWPGVDLVRVRDITGGTPRAWRGGNEEGQP
jgi:hypothetical protein